MNDVNFRYFGLCERALEEYENGAEDAVKKYLEVCCVRLDGLIKLVQGE